MNDVLDGANLFDIARDDDLLDALAAREHVDHDEDGTDDVSALLAAWVRHIDDETSATFSEETASASISTAEDRPLTAGRRGGSYRASPRHGVSHAIGRGWWELAPSARVRTGATAAAAGLVMSLTGVAAAVGGARLPALHGLTLTSSSAQNPETAGEVAQASATNAPVVPQAPEGVAPQALPRSVGGRPVPSHHALEPDAPEALSPEGVAPDSTWSVVEPRRTTWPTPSAVAGSPARTAPRGTGRATMQPTPPMSRPWSTVRSPFTTPAQPRPSTSAPTSKRSTTPQRPSQTETPTTRRPSPTTSTPSKPSSTTTSPSTSTSRQSRGETTVTPSTTASRPEAAANGSRAGAQLPTAKKRAGLHQQTRATTSSSRGAAAKPSAADGAATSKATRGSQQPQTHEKAKRSSTAARSARTTDAGASSAVASAVQ